MYLVFRGLYIKPNILQSLFQFGFLNIVDLFLGQDKMNSFYCVPVCTETCGEMYGSNDSWKKWDEIHESMDGFRSVKIIRVIIILKAILKTLAYLSLMIKRLEHYPQDQRNKIPVWSLSLVVERPSLTTADDLWT